MKNYQGNYIYFFCVYMTHCITTQIEFRNETETWVADRKIHISIRG